MTQDEISCPHVGDSNGCDDCKLGLNPLFCQEEFSEYLMEYD